MIPSDQFFDIRDQKIDSANLFIPLKSVVINTFIMKSHTHPIPDEIVMVIPTKITNLGVYVSLPEYNDIEGLIILSEICKKRMRSINQEVKVGRSFPAVVLNVDDVTGNISLSKKSVTESDKARCVDNFRKYRLVTDIMKQVQRKSNTDLRNLFEKFIWPLESKVDQTQHVLDTLKMATKQFDGVYDGILSDTDSDLIENFKEVLQHKFKDETVNLQAVISLYCVEDGGVGTIKEILATGQSVESQLAIKLITPPFYGIFLKCKDQQAGLEQIMTSIDVIKEKATKLHAVFSVVKTPVVTTADELPTNLADADLSEEEEEEEEESV
jgi:translation initiation factor 2 subunit 1